MRRVLVHCMLANAGAWRGVLKALGDAEAATPELPGHGAAPAPAAGEDYLDAARRGIADAVGAGPVHLIGHSFGAVAALAHALARPGTVDRLTLIEPVLFAAAPGTRAGGDAFEDALRQGDFERAAPGFHALWGEGRWTDLPASVRAYIVPRMAWVAAGGPALHEDTAGILAPGRLEGLNVPATLIGGTESPPATAAILDALGSRLPQAHRRWIDGAGHMAPVTHSAEVAALL